MSAGSTPWEFMAEVVLNLHKVLVVLFGNSRDLIREGLRKLGYTPDETEQNFLPIDVLRNKFDVAHPSLGTHKASDLDTLYRYLEVTDRIFRELLTRVLGKLDQDPNFIEAGYFGPLENEAQTEFNKIIKNLESRKGYESKPSDKHSTMVLALRFDNGAPVSIAP